MYSASHFNALRFQLLSLCLLYFLLRCDTNLDLNRRFLERASSNKAERLDKHRFLVQAMEISDEKYAKVVAIAPNQRSEEVSHILFFL